MSGFILSYGIASKAYKDSKQLPFMSSFKIWTHNVPHILPASQTFHCSNFHNNLIFLSRKEEAAESFFLKGKDDLVLAEVPRPSSGSTCTTKSTAKNTTLFWPKAPDLIRACGFPSFLNGQQKKKEVLKLKVWVTLVTFLHL